MNLSTILEEYNLNLESVKLVRHAYSRVDVQEICEQGFIEEYLKEQDKPIFDKCTHVLSFLGTDDANAIFLGCYKVGQKCSGSEKKSKCPPNFPYPEFYNVGCHYELELTDIMSELKNRLVIHWGKGTRMFHHWATQKKEIVAIYSPKNMRKVRPFKSYEETILSFIELETIANDPITYEDWHSALSNINCIYLICDTKNGWQYIGSTYGTGGIIERWKDYIVTKDGGDIGIKKELDKNPMSYKKFQFSILRILPKSVTQDEAINIETLYKRKLCSRQFGTNKN